MPMRLEETVMLKSSARQVYTFDDLRRLALSARVAASISLGVSLAIIVITIWIYFTPSARHHLDRISFRLLFCMMVFEVGYETAWVGLFHAWPVYTPPEAACTVGMLTLFGCLATVNYLCACIAINLALTVVFNINPRQKHLERWYIGASLVLGFGVILVPTTMGHFGKNTSRGGKNSFCWFKQVPNEKVKIVRYFLDFYIWQCLSALVASIFVAMLVFKLWRQGRQGSRLALAGLTFDLSPDPTGTDASTLRTLQPSIDGLDKTNGIILTDPFAPHQADRPPPLSIVIPSPLDPRSPSAPVLDVAPISPLPILAPSRRFSKARFGRPSVTESQATRVNSLNQLHSKLHGIIWRVSAYPVALVIVNILHTAPDIYLVTHGGIRSSTDWRLYCIFTFLYGSRGLFFALLMILVDPCLRKGFKATWNVRVRKRTQEHDGDWTSATACESQTPRVSSGPGLDPVMALASSSNARHSLSVADDDDDVESLDIFQFFASTSGRNSVATTTTTTTTTATTMMTETDASPKSVRIASSANCAPGALAVVAAAAAAAAYPTGGRVGLATRSMGRRRILHRVDEDAEEEKAEKFFSHVESLL